VNPLRFPLLADENIGPEVVAGLRTRGCDIRTAAEEALLGQPDASVLARAQLQARVVVTHDRGFGRSAIATGTPFVGIVYLRPGHISSTFVLDIADSLLASAVDVQPPFLAIAERQGTDVRVRVRIAPPW
jgi:predicted nuclease of predicted toxin-antitoxin system